MAGDSSFRCEDFLEAITSQLDRTQDALRLKAVNRPLTYAIRDFSLEPAGLRRAGRRGPGPVPQLGARTRPAPARCRSASPRSPGR